MIRKAHILLSLGVVLLFVNPGCGSDGKEGTAPLNCSSHGTLHDGHCHCDTGYLYNGKTCVTPRDITDICIEEAPATHGDDAGIEEHEDKACLCPSTGECPCDHGKVETYATKNYCVPELHAE